MAKYKVGDVVRVRTWTDGMVEGRVVDYDEDGKDGRPTISYERTSDGEGFWCYTSQVESVVSRAGR